MNTDFAFTELVNDPLARIESAALGASTSTGLTQKDIGKVVKLSTAQNYILVTAGDDIQGFVNSVEPFSVNGGFGFGGVQRSGRKVCVVDAAQVGAVTIGNLLVAGAQAVVGTAGAPKVKEGSPAVHLWRVLRILSGTGVAGDSILIERI